MSSNLSSAKTPERMSMLWKQFKQRLGLIQKETRSIEGALEEKNQSQETEKIRTRIRGL